MVIRNDYAGPEYYFRRIMELADSAMNPNATEKMTKEEALKRISQIANHAMMCEYGPGKR